jgi:hypothetical protein
MISKTGGNIQCMAVPGKGGAGEIYREKDHHFSAWIWHCLQGRKLIAVAIEPNPSMWRVDIKEATSMSRKISTTIYALITILAIQPTMAWSPAAEKTGHDWAVLMAIRPGEKLYVKLEDGSRANGILNSVSETMLVLSDDNQTTVFGRQDIQEIRLARGRSLKKSILMGTLIGTGAGAGLGGAAAASDNGKGIDVKASEGIPIGAAVGAIFGALIGLGIGFLPRQGDLIYKAKHD